MAHSIYDSFTRITNFLSLKLSWNTQHTALANHILKAFQNNLPPIAAGKLECQLSALNTHRINNEGKVWSFLSMTGVADEIDPAIRLAFCRDLPIPVASARIRGAGASLDPRARVDLIVQRGVFRTLIFDTPPRAILGSKAAKIGEVVVQDVDILFDPMNPSPFPVNSTRDHGSLPGWIQQYLSGAADVEMLTPLPSEMRTRFLEFYDLWFPDDYLEFVAAAECLTIPDRLELFGLSHLFSYITPREYVVQLADIPDRGCLCLLRRAEPSLYFIDYNWDHIPQPVGTSLQIALAEAMDFKGK